MVLKICKWHSLHAYNVCNACVYFFYLILYLILYLMIALQYLDV